MASRIESKSTPEQYRPVDLWKKLWLASGRIRALVLPAMLSVVCWSAAGRDLVPQTPATTNLEIRLLSATGSRVSHTGDRVRGLVIAPVVENGAVIVPQGSILAGSVIAVHPLGLGLRRCTASLELQFDSLEYPRDSTEMDVEQPGSSDEYRATLPVAARVLQVETAKERVNGQGVVGGIHPALNVSSGASLFISALMMQPVAAVPVMGVKFLLLRSPDPEIYFPAGTEMIVQMILPSDLPRVKPTVGYLADLSEEDEEKARILLQEVPAQQAEQGRKDQPSDLANLLILGRQDQIDRAFRAAGWSGAQAHNAIALYRMFYCVVSRAGYSRAPMRRLKMNGVSQQAEYQKSLDTFAKRHHIRLWNQTEDGARSDMWLSAATEDVSFTVHKMLVNHVSDPNIDNERAKVVNDLALTGCLDAASVISREDLHFENVGARAIVTDGKIAAVRLNDCRNPKNLVAVERHPVTSKLAHISAVVARDIVRSNPVSLGFYASNMMLNQEDAHLKALELRALAARNHQPRQSGAAGTLLSTKWKRPSVVAAPIHFGDGFLSASSR